MVKAPTINKLETHETPNEEIEEELYEELSAMEQAMASEEKQNEGTFLTGGNTRDFVDLNDVEKPLDEEMILTPPDVRDGPELLEYLRHRLHKFDSPYAYIGGEANSPSMDGYRDAEVRILISRLSTYESTSLSMSHSLMAQIYGEMEKVFCDLAFLPKPNDMKLLRENNFPAWFGIGTKLKAHRFDVLSITHAVSMEQLNFVPLLYESGIPLFKQQRMERTDIPIIVVGGANSGTTAPLSGTFTDSKGNDYSHLIDCVIYGDGEEAAKEFIEVVREGKKAGLSKKQILRNCHGRVEGFYEPDCYDHVYDGKGTLTEVKKAEGCDYVQLPVTRATVQNLDSVRTLEQKILPYTGDGASVDVAIAGSVGCIGSAGWGACSFCREGSEGPYRERSLDRVMDALDSATKNQGTKEVSFFSLNFNQYADFFPLVAESVKRGFKVGLISQRIDMLAETPEQIRVQRWLKKSNFTLGVEGISGRTRAYLNKNLQEWEILSCAAEMMKEGAGELKFFQIVTGLETDHDVEEFCALMEKVNAIRQKLGATTRFRVSFTPLFPSAFTALQFAPCNAAIKHGERSLDRLFQRAKELGWGRRLSVSGEEPLVSNTINHGGRNITHLLLKSYFSDGYVFYGNVPQGTWERWERRIEEDPNIDLDITWGEKSFEYVFPWEDIAYSTSKEIMWRGYMKAVAFQGVTYCLSTRTIKGVCHVNECGACLVGETLIHVQGGIKRLDECQVGDTVLTTEGWLPVTKFLDQGEKATLKVSLSDGSELTLTPDHRVLSEGNWKEVGDLKVGSPLTPSLSTSEGERQKMPGVTSFRAKTPVHIPEFLGTEMSWALGYIAGDGNITAKELRLFVADSQSELDQPLVAAMGQFGLLPSSRTSNGRNEGACHVIPYGNVDLAHYLSKDLNVKGFIPRIVMESPSEIRAAYLRGLFDADGTVTMTGRRTHLSLATKKPEFARQVQQLLRSLGVRSRIATADRASRWNSLPENRVVVNGASGWISYTKHVGFRLKCKQQKLLAALEVVKTRRKREAEERISITGIEGAGIRRVFDIEVAGAHNFTAGSVIVHNCDPHKTGKPNAQIMKEIVGRKVAPTIPTEKIAEMARSREKSYHLRVLFRTTDPIYRFVLKGYFQHAIPRALMHTSSVFNHAYVGSIGHARIAAGANMAKDWTFGNNIYDFSLSDHIPESELRKMIEPANELIREGEILDIRMDSHLTVLRNDVDYAVYTMFIPNHGMNFKRIRDDVEKYMDRKSAGKSSTIKIKKTQGKGVFVTVEQTLDGKDVRTISYQWMPEYRGTLLRMVISANYNPMAMLEAITGRKAFSWKEFPIYCDGYVQLGQETGEADVFAALFGEAEKCKETGQPLEMDLFSGKKFSSGVGLAADGGLDINYPVNMDLFFTRQLQAIDTESIAAE